MSQMQIHPPHHSSMNRHHEILSAVTAHQQRETKRQQQKISEHIRWPCQAASPEGTVVIRHTESHYTGRVGIQFNTIGMGTG